MKYSHSSVIIVINNQSTSSNQQTVDVSEVQLKGSVNVSHRIYSLYFVIDFYLEHSLAIA